MTSLPIRGKTSTSFHANVELGPSSDPEYDALFAEIDDGTIEVSLFPPHPYDFTIENHKPLHRWITPMTVEELHNKIKSAPQDSLLVILGYDRWTKVYHVEPREIISMIDYRDDEKELGLYSVYYEDGKMIECSQLQSAFSVDQDGKASMLKSVHSKDVMVPDNTPLYLYSKSEGKLNVTDVVTFRGTSMTSERNYLGIVVENDIFVPDLECDDEEMSSSAEA